MYVVIVGAGEVGSYVARILVDEGHEVALVEVDEELARRLDASLNALVVPGSGISVGALRRAEIERAELLLAVTGVDEVNLITCMTARKYGSPQLRALARVRQSRMLDGDTLSAEELGLDALISPEEAMANAIDDSIRFPGTGEMHELAEGRLVLVGMELTIESPFVHDTLESLQGDLPKDSVVVAVHGSSGFRIPTGADQFRVNERVFVLTSPQHVAELAILSGVPWYHVKRLLIVGCGNTGLAVARRLEDAGGFSLTIIERDPQRAELVAGLLPRALVLHGDGSDPEFLQSRIEAGDIDAVLVLLKDSEKSVLGGVFAKSLGARKVIVRCDKPAYGHLANRVGVDALISPKHAMTDAILRCVRRGMVRSTMVLGEHEVELTEFSVPARPKRGELLEKPLGELRFPRGALVAAVIRDGTVAIPTDESVLRPGDRLLVACQPPVLGWIEDLLA